MPQPVLVRRYKGSPEMIQRLYQRDLKRMAAQGYVVESQATIPGKRGGCGTLLGVLTLGLLFLFVRPRDTLMVTYRLAR